MLTTEGFGNAGRFTYLPFGAGAGQKYRIAGEDTLLFGADLDFFTAAAGAGGYRRTRSSRKPTNNMDSGGVGGTGGGVGGGSGGGSGNGGGGSGESRRGSGGGSGKDDAARGADRISKAGDTTIEKVRSWASTSVRLEG